MNHISLVSRVRDAWCTPQHSNVNRSSVSVKSLSVAMSANFDYTLMRALHELGMFQ